MTAKFQIRDNEEQYIALQKAIQNRGYLRGGKDLSPSGVANELRRFDERRTRQLDCLNPWTGEKWAAFLSVPPYPKQTPSYRLFCVTIIPTIGQIDLNLSRSADQLHAEVIKVGSKVMRKCRNILHGKCDFLLMLEAALHVVDKKRKIFSIHAHGIAWGEKNTIQGALAGLPKGIGGAPGGKVTECQHRDGWLNYMSKDLRCKSNINQQDGEWLRPKSERLTKDDQLTLLEAFGDLTKPELAFAAGAGVSILRSARNAALEKGYQKFNGNRWEPS